VGAGLLYRIPYSAHVLLALSVFVLQVFFSRWWLRRHEMGPLEHLWRWLSAGRRRRVVAPARVHFSNR